MKVSDIGNIPIELEQKEWKQEEEEEEESIVRLMQMFGQKTKESLATNDKYWKSPCNVTSRDALDAINRAKTDKCRKEISSISCMTRDNVLFPDFIQR